MSTREYWLMGSRAKVSMRPEDGADVILAWRQLPGYAPVIMAKKRFMARSAEGLTVRTANAADMPAIRGLYDMTGGRAALMPVREGLWTADDALVAEDASGRVAAFCQGSDMAGVWNIHNWGINPEIDVVAAASAFAVHGGCRRWQIRAEFAPVGGTYSASECVYIGVPKPFLLGTVMIESAQQLAEMIEQAQRG